MATAGRHPRGGINAKGRLFSRRRRPAGHLVAGECARRARDWWRAALPPLSWHPGFALLPLSTNTPRRRGCGRYLAPEPVRPRMRSYRPCWPSNGNGRSVARGRSTMALERWEVADAPVRLKEAIDAVRRRQSNSRTSSAVQDRGDRRREGLIWAQVAQGHFDADWTSRFHLRSLGWWIPS